jgi:hypothetical protein
LDLVSRVVLGVALPASRAGVAFALLPVVLGAAGCFDVHSFDPGPHIIDDFEDGDLYPADPSFGPWYAYSFNPTTNRNYSFGLDPGYKSNYSLYLEFTINDALDGAPDYGGAGLATSATVAPQDLSGFSDLVFNAKLESQDPALPSSTVVYVVLGCKTALTDAVTQPDPDDIIVVQTWTYAGGGDWQATKLATSGFGNADWKNIHIVGGPAACLERVDSIQFQVNPNLLDGQSAMGRLNIDQVYLQ